MKNLKYLFCSILLFLSCNKETDLLDIEEKDITTGAKHWLEENTNSELYQNLFFNDSLDWDNSFQNDHSLFLPVIKHEGVNIKNANNSLVNGKKSENVYTKSFVIIEKGNYNDYTQSLMVFYSKNKDNLEIDFRNQGLGYFKFDSNNLLTEFISNENINQDITISDKIKDNSNELSNRGDCSTYYVVETSNYSDGTSTSLILATYEVCFGQSGGGGSSGGGGAGGGSGGNVLENLFEQTNQNFLCGSYSWSTIGSSNVVNISGLGLNMSGPYGQVINVEWGNLCVTIPNYSTPSYSASSKFNSAWGISLVQFVDYLNLVGDLADLNPVNTSALIKTLLDSNLKSIVPGSSVSSGFCNGVQTSQADYCN